MRKQLLGGEKPLTAEHRERCVTALKYQTKRMTEEAARLVANAPRVAALAERIRTVATQEELESLWR
jgi:hypothetical protein